MEQTIYDKLCFYSKSKDMRPGKGAGEIVENHELYFELEKYKDWRKVLSNFHVYPFIFEDYTYNTIEHVFQAKKIEIVDPDKAYLFTVDSGSELGIGNGEIARKNRKLVKLNNKELQKWCQIKDDIMLKASIAKYSHCEEACNILKKTNKAQLWHIVSRSKPIRFNHLEYIRDLCINKLT
jgi:predicted NAD-dependent protein-ADP-ribosyltransferase YbiA (DUF1768 family)